MSSQRAKTAWTVRPLNSTTFVIRETDRFGEFPNIYVRPIYLEKDREEQPKGSSTAAKVDVILLIDTGCGTNAPVETVPEDGRQSRLLSLLGLRSATQPPAAQQVLPETMTLHSFLSTWPVPELGGKPLNPDGSTPYLVALSHCHYDHLMGLTYFPTTKRDDSRSIMPIPAFSSSRSSTNGYLDPPPVTVLSSSNSASFISPAYPNLYEHSLCRKLNLDLPDYIIGYWSRHKTQIIWPPPQYVKYPDPKPLPWTSPDCQATEYLSHRHKTGIYTYHTPGHTPDSLSIYDSISRQLYIGDMIYERATPETIAAGEPAMPIMFSEDSNLRDWFQSISSLLRLVDTWNNEYTGLYDEKTSSVIEVVRELTPHEVSLSDYVGTYIDPQSHAFQSNPSSSTTTTTITESLSLLSVRKHQDGTLVSRHKNFFSRNDTLIFVKDSPSTSTSTSPQRASSSSSFTSSTSTSSWTNLTLLYHELPNPNPHPVHASSAHTTTSTPASPLLSSALKFLNDVIEGKVVGEPFHRQQHSSSSSSSSSSHPTSITENTNNISPSKPKIKDNNNNSPFDNNNSNNNNDDDDDDDDDTQLYIYHLKTPTGENTGTFSVLTPLSIVKKERERRKSDLEGLFRALEVEEGKGDGDRRKDERERERESRRKERRERMRRFIGGESEGGMVL